MFALCLISSHCYGDSHYQGLNQLCKSQCVSQLHVSGQVQKSLASSLSHSMSLRVLCNINLSLKVLCNTSLTLRKLHNTGLSLRKIHNTSLSLRVLKNTILTLRNLCNLIQALILSAAQPSELRAWRLHSHRHRITWSMRTLASFAAAAATEDRKGVLHSPSQPDCPDLATIIAILLSAKQVLQVGW